MAKREESVKEILIKGQMESIKQEMKYADGRKRLQLAVKYCELADELVDARWWW